MAEDFNSKYSGEQVEELLDQVASGNTGGGGGITVETDPIFSASPAASITAEKIAEWDNKVDKVDGKQLSTEDFTTVLKNKLDGLNNYDDTTISQAVDKLRTDLDALVSGDTTTAIKTFNEVIAFLDGISDTEDLSSIIASIEQQIAGKMDNVTLAKVATSGNYNDLSNKPTIPDVNTKQDKIADLDAIRSGAEKGATSVQPSDLYNDNNGEILPRLIVKKGLIEDTEVGLTYALPFSSEESLGDADTTLATTDLAEQIARSVAFIEEEDSSTIVTRAKNGLFQVEVDGELGEIFALPNLGEDLQGEADHVLATDKDIQRLDGKVYAWKPASFVINSTFSVSGDYWWIKNSKIVILDLGTTRYISAPITIDASGNITLNFVNHTATGMQIITALIDTNQRCTTSVSSVTFPTIDEKESWSGKQNALVSGTNIKTINNQSLLGSGNITIGGGGDGGGVYLTPFTVEQFCVGFVQLTNEQRDVLINAASQNRIIGMPYSNNLGYDNNVGYIVADYQYEYSSDNWILTIGIIHNGSYYSNYITHSSINFTPGRISVTHLRPNMYVVTAEDGVAEVNEASGFPDNSIYYVEGECTELYIYLEPSGIGKTVRFLTGESCTLEVANTVYWANGEVPIIESYTHYELSLVVNMEGAFNAVLTSFKPVE